VSLPDLKDWRDQNTVFEGFAAYQTRSFSLSRAGNPEQASGREVTANYFDIMAGIQHARTVIPAMMATIAVYTPRSKRFTS